MPRPATSTVIDPPETHPRQLGYRLTTLALAAIVGVALIDGLTPAAILGVDTATTRAADAGYELAVTYGEVSRPALATPFDIRVVHEGGFDEPVRIAVDQEYLRMWDENGLVPAPATELAAGSFVVWEFEPPTGDELLVSYDARIEPAAQEGRSGRVAVLGDADQVLVAVDFTTRLLP